MTNLRLTESMANLVEATDARASGRAARALVFGVVLEDGVVLAASEGDPADVFSVLNKCVDGLDVEQIKRLAKLREQAVTTSEKKSLERRERQGR